MRDPRRTRRLRALMWVAVGWPAGLAGAWAADCARTSVGLTPLIDMGFSTYQGFEGGLYPGGATPRPASHEADADDFARLPLRAADGAPDAVAGRIVLLTVGMSNTSIESSAFIPVAAADPMKNARVTIVNGAQGGWDAARVVDPNQNAVFWNTIDQRLAQAGVTPLQVGAVWLKEAEARPTQSFPQDAQLLQGHLAEIVGMLRSRYASIRQVYLSNRIYAGYAATALNPEPYAYQSGFSVKWLIEDQLGGEPSLNFNPLRGPVAAPWLSWGPYLWADGLSPRSDGLIWECADLRADDGTHPSAAGAGKVAALLDGFFRADPIASRWFADCDPNDPSVFSSPPRVLDLDVTRDPGNGAIRLQWESLGPLTGPGTRYDVVTGLAGALRPAGGFLNAVCALAGVPASSGPDPSPDPPAGGIVYYLARGRNVCGAGTFGEPDALAGPRAALDAASPCPDN